MVVMRRVEHAVIITPVRVARLDYWRKTPHRSLRHTMTLDEVKYGGGGGIICDPGKKRQSSTKSVEPLADGAEPKIRNIVMLRYQNPFHREPPLAPQRVLRLLALGAEGVGDVAQHVTVSLIPEVAIDLLSDE